ncbi:MAG: rhodanese-like domain-containing protein [Patescibacteria group bacterium]
MKNITPAEADKILKEDKNAILVDVRTKDEVSEISVPDAKHIPLDELAGRLGEIKNFSHVLFLCRSGGRSAEACSIAESAGFSNVMNVAGGIIAWEKAGLLVAKG